MTRANKGQRVFVPSWIRLLLVASSLFGCDARQNATSDVLPSRYDPECSTPNDGCPCTTPGEQVSCGESTDTHEDKVLCGMGQRTCQDNGKFGACEIQNHRFVESATRRRHVLALGSSEACGTLNPCDPYCTYVDDDSTDLGAELPTGLCETKGGLALCTRCDDYASPHRSSDYAALPTTWKSLPTECQESPTADGEGCPYDYECVTDECVPRSAPCFDAAPAGCTLTKKLDLTVGPPCLSGTSYHIPVCNRGADRADAGTLRLGLYSASNRGDDCVSPEYALPDEGTITFDLGTDIGTYIDPGTCLDITPANSTSSGADFADIRGILVNYLGSGDISECNYCNNWNVLVPTTACSGCTGLSCSQVCAATTLSGTIYDPAGQNPLPGVAVYVPSDAVSAFVDDQVACDTCTSLYSGSPIASTVTNADGTFTLGNVPSGTSFPLVIQTGRWRRQVTVSAIEPCASATLPVGESSQLPSKAAEGDIPRMAILMGDADPLQCLFRRIGIEDSEFSASTGTGRVHLYNANGMQYTGARPAYTGTNPLLEDTAQMDKYAAIFAPCDYSHGQYTSDYVDRSGPTYNGLPDPSTTATERANMLAYVNKGGRLFTTHWLSMDFVHMNYNPPPTPSASVCPTKSPPYKCTVPSSNQAILSPYDPSSFSAFRSELSAIGKRWTYTNIDDFNPTVPAVHLFGRPIEAQGNNSDPLPPSFSPINTAFKYTIDTSTELGTLFRDWSNVVDASPDGSGTVRFDSWASLVHDVRPPAVRLAYGDSTDESRFHVYSGTEPSTAQSPCVYSGSDTSVHCTKGTSKTWAGPHVALFAFDTPWGSAAESQCGRVVVSQNHVTSHQCYMPSSKNRAPTACGAASDVTKECATKVPPYTVDTGTNPAPDCGAITLPANWSRGCGPTMTMTAQEKAFEFMVFATTQCMGSTVTTPPVVTLMPQTFVRDYQANCGVGEQVRWQYLYWQSAIMAGTSIDFAAQTAETEEGLDSAPLVDIGTSTESTTTWTTDTKTIDTHFRSALPPQGSREWLRVSMTLNPDGASTPVLTSWRLVYDCEPAE